MLPRTFREYFGQFRHTLAIYPATLRFFKKYRLWEGEWDFRWVSRVMMVVAAVVGLKMLGTFSSWWSHAHFNSLSDTVNQMGMLAGSVFESGYSLFYASGLKYLMFVLLYIATAHFSNQTMNILTGKTPEVVTFQNMVAAQMRALKVYIRCWILELIISSVMLGIFFSIFKSFAFLETPAIFLVSCYFTGFAVVDSYNEMFGLSISESMRYTRSYIGIALATGLLAQMLLAVPVFGPILMPVVSGIATTIAMYELSDLHLLDRELVVQLDDLV